MTKVLEIKELYKLIPETAKLENVNFGNLRQLLTSVIEKVEKSGTWEFVQYISASPSLFIVRENKVNKNYSSTSLSQSPIEEINNHYNQKNEVISEPKKKVSESKKHEKDIEQVEVEQSILSQTSKLFEKTDLPW